MATKQVPQASNKSLKKPMSKGAKIALVVGGILAVLFIGMVIVGMLVAGSVFGFLRDNTVKVDEKNGSVEVTTQDGQSTFSSKAELPKGYPDDIPVYPAAEVVYSVVKDGEGSNVTLRSADSIEKVTAYYEAQLAAQGWAKTKNNSTYFTSGIGFAEKLSRSLSFIVTQESKDGKASTVIVVTEKSN